MIYIIFVKIHVISTASLIVIVLLNFHKNTELANMVIRKVKLLQMENKNFSKINCHLSIKVISPPVNEKKEKNEGSDEKDKTEKSPEQRRNARGDRTRLASVRTDAVRPARRSACRGRDRGDGFRDGVDARHVYGDGHGRVPLRRVRDDHGEPSALQPQRVQVLYTEGRSGEAGYQGDPHAGGVRLPYGSARRSRIDRQFHAEILRDPVRQGARGDRPYASAGGSQDRRGRGQRRRRVLCRAGAGAARRGHDRVPLSRPGRHVPEPHSESRK